MPTLWTYPWTLKKEGVRKACEEIAQLGFDSITFPAHYHSVQTFEPRFRDSPFDSHPGGCYFTPDPSRFGQSEVEPVPVDVAGFDDPVDEITSVAHETGLNVNAWVVCFHNSRLARTNPDFRVESAFGDKHDHSICPSASGVQSYFASVMEAIVDRDVDEVQLESIGFPCAFHPHGWDFGHSKRHVLTEPTEVALLSQCFCEHCRSGMAYHGVNVDTARNAVHSFIDQRFDHPATDPPSSTELVQKRPELGELFEYRKDTITEFLTTVSEAVDRTPLNYYMMEWPGFTVDDVQFSGVDVDEITEILDRITALCYVDTPEAVRHRIEPITDITGNPVDAGVTLDPTVVDSRDHFEAVIDELHRLNVENISVYHHSLESQSQLEWVQQVLND